MEPPDKPTFDRVASEHRGFIRRALAQLGVRTSDLDDVAQEVLHGIQRGLPTFDPHLSTRPKTALQAWIFGICERQAAHYHRTVTRQDHVLCLAPDPIDQAPDPTPSPEAHLLQQEQHTRLFALVAALEPHRRAVLLAHDMEELRMALVAAQLAIPLNTAWNRLRLARADLRAAWHRRMSTRFKKP